MPIHQRLLTGVAVLLLAAGGVGAAAGSVAGADAPPTTPAPAPTTPAPATPVTYYRAVGCRVRGPAVAYFHGPRRRVVAIGFDDGPWTDTSSFVHMLARNHAVATFFMIGEQVTPAYTQTLRTELRYGDALGDHTYTHPYLTRADVASQLQRTQAAIERLSGYTPCVMRPPYGAYDPSVVATARSLGMATVLWNVDPSDWALPGTAAIEQRVLAQVQPGSIIISHDGGGPRGQTLAAYPAIISALRARGYQLETIPQMLGLHTEYVRCLRDCLGAAVAGPLPPGSIVLHGASPSPPARSRAAATRSPAGP